jgi:hypothetical protein
MIEQAITVTDDVITIAGHLFVHKDFSITDKELIFDIISTRYSGQRIRVVFWDGENIEFSGFTYFIKHLCTCINIPFDCVTIETHDPEYSDFNTVTMSPGIFLSAGRELDSNHHVHDYVGKKFVGTVLGRFNPTRLRLIYTIDHCFPEDNYTIFQTKVDQVTNKYRHVAELYQKELSWLSTKQFDTDIASPHPSGMISWHDSNRHYLNICNNYQIEIISETDAFSKFWVTEKTARCLAIGKPFVLIAGTSSLQRLRDLGFVTFGSVIDETYDRALTPTHRIKLALNSLSSVYHARDRHGLVDDLYQMAALNKEIYRKHTTE